MSTWSSTDRPSLSGILYPLPPSFSLFTPARVAGHARVPAGREISRGPALNAQCENGRHVIRRVHESPIEATLISLPSVCRETSLSNDSNVERERERERKREREKESERERERESERERERAKPAVTEWHMHAPAL